MSEKYLNHKIECPFCRTIRLRIPQDVRPDTRIVCDDCGRFLGLWGELEADFAHQGGQNGVFSLNDGRIKRLTEKRD
jgi:hypothetical protein